MENNSVFDVNNGTTTEKRVKLISTASTFTASWDSSASDVNDGYGINQCGESTYEDGTVYEGADLKQLLNGFYISIENSTCTYCDGKVQDEGTTNFRWASVAFIRKRNKYAKYRKNLYIK